jgi:MoaA/NifB/PqqE/SkfB family radical SAM enzyme
MAFPQFISFTITNNCNLRCKMCGQWSEQGYIYNKEGTRKEEMTIKDWQRLADEAAAHHISSLLIRGGEPFLFPDIIELLQYIHDKGIFISIDSNGTLLKKYAADLLRIGNIHITVSIDGPEDIHDQVRNVKGCFGKIKEGLHLLDELEKSSKNKISRSICFTISPYSMRGLEAVPHIARSLAIKTISIVPYYYIPDDIGKAYEKELAQFNCRAFSWRGFHHESSGIDFSIFQQQYKEYLKNLGDIYNYPYMAFSEEQYRKWFNDSVTPVGSVDCSNIERLIDIQPSGEANFCVDFPDFTIGNVRDSTIEELWNNEKATRFREYRRKNLFSVCYRCGAKYMSEAAG